MYVRARVNYCIVSWPITGQIFAIDTGVPHFIALDGGDLENPDKLYLSRMIVRVSFDAKDRAIVCSFV